MSTASLSLRSLFKILAHLSPTKSEAPFLPDATSVLQTLGIVPASKNFTLLVLRCGASHLIGTARSIRALGLYNMYSLALC